MWQGDKDASSMMNKTPGRRASSFCKEDDGDGAHADADVGGAASMMMKKLFFSKSTPSQKIMTTIVASSSSTGRSTPMISPPPPPPLPTIVTPPAAIKSAAPRVVGNNDITAVTTTTNAKGSGSVGAVASQSSTATAKSTSYPSMISLIHNNEQRRPVGWASPPRSITSTSTADTKSSTTTKSPPLDGFVNENNKVKVYTTATTKTTATATATAMQRRSNNNNNNNKSFSPVTSRTVREYDTLIQKELDEFHSMLDDLKHKINKVVEGNEDNELGQDEDYNNERVRTEVEEDVLAGEQYLPSFAWQDYVDDTGSNDKGGDDGLMASAKELLNDLLHLLDQPEGTLAEAYAMADVEESLRRTAFHLGIDYNMSMLAASRTPVASPSGITGQHQGHPQHFHEDTPGCVLHNVASFHQRAAVAGAWNQTPLGRPSLRDDGGEDAFMTDWDDHDSNASPTPAFSSPINISPFYYQTPTPGAVYTTKGKGNGVKSVSGGSGPCVSIRNTLVKNMHKVLDGDVHFVTQPDQDDDEFALVDIEAVTRALEIVFHERHDILDMLHHHCRNSKEEAGDESLSRGGGGGGGGGGDDNIIEQMRRQTSAGEDSLGDCSRVVPRFLDFRTPNHN